MRIQNSRMLPCIHTYYTCCFCTDHLLWFHFLFNKCSYKRCKIRASMEVYPSKQLINGINITMNHHSLASTSSLSHFIQRSEHAHYTYPYTINRIYRKINTKYIQHSTAVCITFFCALLLLTYCIIQHSFLTMHKKCSIL